MLRGHSSEKDFQACLHDMGEKSTLVDFFSIECRKENCAWPWTKVAKTQNTRFTLKKCFQISSNMHAYIANQNFNYKMF